MESQKIINLLDSNDNESQKFTTKRWYIINDQNTGNNAYGDGEDSTTIKFETKVIKPNLCDYSDAYILVTGNIQNKLANSVVDFKSLEKNNNIFQTTRFNHTMIFFKLIH